MPGKAPAAPVGTARGRSGRQTFAAKRASFVKSVAHPHPWSSGPGRLRREDPVRAFGSPCGSCPCRTNARAMTRFVVVALAALAAGCGPPPEAETPDVDTFCRTAHTQRWACEAATQRALGAVFDTNDGCGLPAPAATAVTTGSRDTAPSAQTWSGRAARRPKCLQGARRTAFERCIVERACSWTSRQSFERRAGRVPRRRRALGDVRRPSRNLARWS